MVNNSYRSFPSSSLRR